MSKPALKQVILSVLAAAIGVQTKSNQEKDFAGGSLAPYVFVGIIAVVLFILTLVTIISFIL